jgi:hypothetical protein
MPNCPTGEEGVYHCLFNSTGRDRVYTPHLSVQAENKNANKNFNMYMVCYHVLRHSRYWFSPSPMLNLTTPVTEECRNLLVPACCC